LLLFCTFHKAPFEISAKFLETHFQLFAFIRSKSLKYKTVHVGLLDYNLLHEMQIKLHAAS